MSSEQIAGALEVLGVNFIFGTRYTDTSLRKQPERLIVALAQSDEAR